ncbi:MAG TPA: class I SAM-dependent rRNA methyltransferase [Terriglobia bacterium]|nr:class I SAM-dependent rRNA methyltransferase [Terriglobia bacterium]
MSQPAVRITSRAIDRIVAGHLWIYRSDAKETENIDPGAVVRLMDRRNHFWGQALYSSQSQIALRLVAREERQFDRDFLAERIQQASAYRERIAAGVEACRVVSSEGDMLPSLVIDRYGDCFVLQTLSQGMEKFKSAIVGILTQQFRARSVIERNDVTVRSLEGLPELKGMLSGEDHSAVVTENGVKFRFDLLSGQKTGGFLDQRENRAAALEYARGRALDCFCYNGGFALTMASRCDSVLAIDSSGDALAAAQANQRLNDIHNVEWREANCFDFLKSADHDGMKFDAVVLDPPAFARQKSHQEAALRAYKELNLRALKILNSGGFLITCSCSYHVSEADFLGVIAAASVDAHRTVTVVERRTQSRDHPILLTVPETHYLKCLILRAV